MFKNLPTEVANPTAQHNTVTLAVLLVFNRPIQLNGVAGAICHWAHTSMEQVIAPITHFHKGTVATASQVSFTFGHIEVNYVGT